MKLGGDIGTASTLNQHPRKYAESIEENADSQQLQNGVPSRANSGPSQRRRPSWRWPRFEDDREHDEEQVFLAAQQQECCALTILSEAHGECWEQESGESARNGEQAADDFKRRGE